MITRSLVVLTLALSVGYGLVEAHPLIVGPTLTLTSPTDFASYSDDTVAISGTAQRVTSLSLNGSPILPHKDGTFSTSFTYPSGGTILTFVAKDRFGRKITQTKTIYIP